MSVAVLENIPPILAVASAITTAFPELVTIASERYAQRTLEPSFRGKTYQQHGHQVLDQILSEQQPSHELVREAVGM